MGSRRFFALLAAGAVAVVPLGAASASASTAKRIAYISGTTLATIGANGTGTSDLGVTANNPSFSSDGQLIVFDAAANVQSIPASGGTPSVHCPGTDPAISPDKTKVAFVFGGAVKVAPLASCVTPSADLGAGSAPAWSPDGQQIVFVDGGGDIAVAPSAGGAAQKLGATTATESSPSWSPDAAQIAYAAGDEIFVMNADGSNRRQLTTNAVVDSSPSWAPGGDEIVYASGGTLVAIAASGSASRILGDAASASQPSWWLAVANTAPPGITLQSGASEPREGTNVSASVGSWISISGITSFGYQWQRCGSAGSGCVDISGATSGTYTLANGDIASTIRVRVVATTPDGSAPALSNPTAVVGAAAPANITPPTISGTAIVGGQLTSTNGTWSGSNPVFTYQWQKCDASGTESSCANISGATFNVYVATQNDVGATLRSVVTATNSLGSATRASLPTPVVVSNVPAVVSPPAISTTVSSTGAVTSLSATTGIWSGATPITFRYQWRRCDANGANCRDIAAAASSVYTPAAADIGSRLRVAVTATNNFGTTTAVSEPSDVLAGTAPENTFRPSISGLESAGSVLSATTGTWTGSTPLTYTYQWRRCNAIGASCTPIPGATATSYVVQAADVGFTISVTVTAKNAAGTATAESGPTDVVTAASPGTPTAIRPSVTDDPSISGRLARGQTLRAVNGTWAGSSPMTFSYQWQRCPATGTTCTAIPLATRSTYVLTTADVGRRIRLVVTASNAAGSAQATTAISARVAATARASGRTISGTARADRLNGGAGNDVIRGSGGNDRINGAGGNDSLFGDSGNDTLNGGAGIDQLSGGSGNDTIAARDGRRDVIDCGAGRDSVVADRVDVVRGCERITRR